jgi:hypothetical protein
MGFSTTSRLSHTCPKNRVYVKIQYLEKGTSVRAKRFRECQDLLDLSLCQISDRNLVI